MVSLGYITRSYWPVQELIREDVSCGMMDDLRFYVLFNIFQSYQDNGWVTMESCVQWNQMNGAPFTTEITPPQAGLKPGLLDQ